MIVERSDDGTTGRQVAGRTALAGFGIGEGVSRFRSWERLDTCGFERFVEAHGRALRAALVASFGPDAGVSVLGIGGAFWVLVIGLIAWTSRAARVRPPDGAHEGHSGQLKPTNRAPSTPRRTSARGRSAAA